MNALAVLTLPFTDFEVRPEVVVLGLLAGMTFGLLGVGLTLIYKTSRVINFAHGDIGAFVVAIFLALTLDRGWGYWPSLLVSLVIAVGLGVVLELIVIRRFERAPRLVVMVATIGVSQVLLALSQFLPNDGFGALAFPTPFTANVEIGSLTLGAGELMVLVLGPLIVGGLAMLLQRSRIGLGARAASENLEAARLAGAPAHKISRVIWVIAALLSVSSAFLVGPLQGLTTSQSLGPSLMVRALAASAIGGFSSLPQVMAGGVAIGVVERLVAWNDPQGGKLELLLLGLIIFTMLVRKDLGRRARGSEDSSWSLGGTIRALEPRLAALPRVRMAKTVGLAVVLALAVLAPVGQPTSRVVLLSSMALFGVIGLSIVILTGFAGQVSLAQFTFVGVGAIVGSRMFERGYPAWVGILYAAIAGGAVAALIGLPALRIRGLFLAVTTLSFAVASATWLPKQQWLVGDGGGGLGSSSLPRQEWFGVDFAQERNYYWICLALLVVSAWLVAHYRTTGAGRRLFAVRDNEAAAGSVSIPPRRTKLTGFVLAGVMAAVAGYFYGGLLVNFSGSTLLQPASSLSLIVMVTFGGVTTVTGALLGALWTQGIPYLFGARWGILSTGAGVLLVLQFAPGGLAELVFRLRDRVVRMLTGEEVGRLQESERAAGSTRQPLPAAPARPEDAPPRPEVPLRAESIRVEFGGVVAVDDVSLHARQGEIVGLVGPNGAGKTTMFDVLTGQIRPKHGQVFIDDRDVTGLRPDQRSLLGLGRSFQDARLFPEIPLVDALKLALEQVEASETVPSLLALPSSRDMELAKDLRAWELVDLLGLGPFANRNCGELSTGTRRFAELGVLIAMGSRVLLLDEPTAGIAQREVEQFIPVLREIRDHLDATIVVIDHDIPMMIGLVDRLYVMNAGKLIADGEPRLLREDPVVVAAYLGTDERAIERSGTLPTAPATGASRRRTTPLTPERDS